MEICFKVAIALSTLVGILGFDLGAASAAPGSDGLDDQPILPRPTAEDGQALWSFDRDVWPSIDNYNGFPAQGASGYGYLLSVMDKSLFRDQVAWRHLTEGLKRMGNVSIEDDEPHGPSRSGPLHRVSSHITSFSPPNATVQACYTYPTKGGQSGASQAIFDLRKTDTTDHWYLHGISNDHVVAGC